MKRAIKWIKGTRPDQSVSQVAERVVAIRLQDVCHFLPLAAKKPKKNIEYVHQLRVATRRATAALRIFEDVLPKRRVRRIEKQLRHVRRAAGGARDLDVLRQRLVREIEMSDDRLKKSIKQVAARRKDAQQPLAKTHRRFKRERFKQEAKSVRQRVRWRGNGPQPRFDEAARGSLRPIVSAFFTAFAEDLSETAALHQLRIRGKRLRYAMELLAGAFDKSMRDDLYPKIVDVQDCLGKVNDHVTAEQTFKQWAKHSRGRHRRSTFRKLQSSEARQIESSCEEFRQCWTPERIAKLKRQFDDLLSERTEMDEAVKHTNQSRESSKAATRLGAIN